MVWKSKRVVSAALEVSSVASSGWGRGRKALVLEFESSKGRVRGFEEIEVSSEFESKLVIAGAQF